MPEPRASRARATDYVKHVNSHGPPKEKGRLRMFYVRSFRNVTPPGGAMLPCADLDEVWGRLTVRKDR